MSTTIKQDLIKLRKLKRHAEELGRKHKSAKGEHAQWQTRVLERLEAEDIDALRSDGTLFSLVEKHKGYVEDLQAFVRHALENDAALQDFIYNTLCPAHRGWGATDDEIQAQVEAFCSMLQNLELLRLEARSELLNAMVRAHLDDGEPLPPGINFRPDPYVSMRSS